MIYYSFDVIPYEMCCLKIACKTTFLILGLLCLPPTQEISADEGADKLSAQSQQLAREWVQGWIKQEKLKIIENHQRQRLDGGESSAPDFDDDPNLYRPLVKPVEESLNAIESKLQTHILQLDARIKADTNSWIEMRALQIERGQERASIEGATSTFGLLAHLFASRNRWIWFCALIASVCLGGAMLHDRRHDFRKKFYGTRAKSLRVVLVMKIFTVTLASFTVVVFLFGGTIHTYLISQGSNVVADSLSKVAAEIKGFPAVEGGDNLPKPNSDNKGFTITPAENRVRTKIQLTAVKNELLVAMYVMMEEHGGKLAANNKYLSGNTNGRNSTEFWGRIFRFLISALLLGGIGYVAVSLKQLIRNRKRLNGDTCPSCMAQGSLIVAESVGDVEVRCNNMVPDPDYPDEEEECGFEIRSIYKQMPKLCFPTLGHPASGKTHWLAMTYRELSHSRFDPAINFARIQGNQTEEFDLLVEDLIVHHQGTGATQVGIPKPLLFHATDKDRYGKTDVLLNLFDYAGEVTTGRSLDDPLRRRALNADGYFFFIDPTLDKDAQAKALSEFAEDVKILKGIDGGRTMQVPVAIVVSKIDTLSREGVMGQFFNELTTLDPNGDEFSLEKIDAFSEMMERYVSTLWPGWPINQAVDRLFDGRFRYFPLTPVGLQSTGEDLANVAQVPYRVLHPLLWLMHMNGYQVLNKRSANRKSS